MPMNSLPRWLISITDMPEPCQSSISLAACSSTSSGRTAGPALKLKTRFATRMRGLGLLPIRLTVPFFFFLLGDALDARELRALVEVDQAHALSRAAHLADLLDVGPYQDPAGGDQHDLVLVAYQHRADDPAVPLGRLDRDHPLGAAAVASVLGDRRALAEAVLGRCEHRLALAVRDQHRHHLLLLAELHAAHPVRLPPHRPHVVLLEAHRLAAVGEEHDVVLAVGDRRADEVVAVVQVHRDDALVPLVREL